MRTYLISLAIEVGVVVEEKYAPKDTDTKEEAKKNFRANVKAMNALLSGLRESEFIKVMHSKATKDIWDTLGNIHEGDTKVKMAKLQAHRTQFENLKMNEDGDIVAFFLRVAEVVDRKSVV